jgi:hypothetical protein
MPGSDAQRPFDPPNSQRKGSPSTNEEDLPVASHLHRVGHLVTYGANARGRNWRAPDTAQLKED